MNSADETKGPRMLYLDFVCNFSLSMRKNSELFQVPLALLLICCVIVYELFGITKINISFLFNMTSVNLVSCKMSIFEYRIHHKSQI